MMITAGKARENVAKYNKMQEEERMKRAKKYVEDVCEVIDRESWNGETSVLVREMDCLTDLYVAKKILKEELKFEVEHISDKGCIRISWEN